MFKQLSLLSCLVAVPACVDPPSTVLDAQWQNLRAEVTLEPDVAYLRENTVQIAGHVTIKNVSAEPQQYSNKWLWIETDTGARSRAYQDSIASQVVDSGAIEIGANGTLSLSVYWPFPESDRADLIAESLTLTLGPKD